MRKTSHQPRSIMTTSHHLHTLHHAPRTVTGKAPLLFVHGGYVDARCWDTHFLPHFASHGHDCYALDLPGHGNSGQRAELDTLGLTDYFAALARAIEGFASKPILIGHSMGACLVERALEQSLARAGVLMSPVPPSGTLESATNLFLRYPQFLGEVTNLTKGVCSASGLQILKQVYFTPATKDEAPLRLARLVQPESLRAISDMALMCWRWRPKAPALPVLVVGGELDTVFPPHMVRRVAKRWRAELRIIPAAGHAMILDEQWRACAAAIEDWLHRLEERGGAAVTRTDQSTGRAGDAGYGRGGRH